VASYWSINRSPPTSPGPSLAARYRQVVWRRTLCLGVLGAALMFALLIDIATGPSGLGLSKVVAGLLDPASLSKGERVIVWSLRLPQALLAIAVGACLGLGGAETQTALNNSLASPYTLGLSWAASLGAVAAIIFGGSWAATFGGALFLVPAAAFAFSLLAGLAILAIAQVLGSRTENIILFGIALVFACTALISLLQFAADADSVQETVFWMMGSVARATWDKVAIVSLVFAAVAPFAWRSAWALTLLRSGEDQALGAGLPVHRLRMESLLRTSLLTAAAVAFVGTIGFVGLVGPHIARLLLGEDHRYFLPGAAVTGALLLSLASIVAKVLVPGVVVPVGIVTALVGVPVFVVLILWRRRHA